jgi:histidinol phosphatase-like enzyme (inositol monophosphatase family)
VRFERELEFACRAAAASADLALRMQPSIVAQEKQDGSPVTQADQECERLIARTIEETFPEDGIVGEEGTRKISSSGRRWIVDPIDGTRDFIRGNQFWAVLIALEAHGEPRVGVAHLPLIGNTYFGVSGGGAFRDGAPIRASGVDRLDRAVVCPNGMQGMVTERYGPELLSWLARCWAVRSLGGCLDAMMVASGRADAYFERKAEIWDLAPLRVILEEAGAVFLAPDGSNRIDGGSAAACAPGIEAEVRAFYCR